MQDQNMTTELLEDQRFGLKMFFSQSWEAILHDSVNCDDPALISHLHLGSQTEMRISFLGISVGDCTLVSPTVWISGKQPIKQKN